MGLIHMRKKIGHMKNIEEFYFYKWAVNDNQLCKRSKGFLINHPDLSLRINHP